MLVRATVCLVKDLGFGVSGLVARQALGDRLFKTIVLRVNGMSALRSFECRVVGLVGCKGFGFRGCKILVCWGWFGLVSMFRSP